MKRIIITLSVLLSTICSIAIIMSSCEKPERVTVIRAEIIYKVGNNTYISGHIVDLSDAYQTDHGFILTYDGGETLTFSLGKPKERGNFMMPLPSLMPNKEYIIRCFITEDGQTILSNNKLTFVTEGFAPTVETKEVLEITQTSATGFGEVRTNGGAPISQRGFVLNTTGNPTVEVFYNKTWNTTTNMGEYTITINELTPNTTYYIRAFATNSVGTGYGEQLTFTTSPLSLPTVVTKSVSDISQTAALAFGDVTLDGGSPVIEKGFVFDTHGNPTLYTNHGKTSNGSGIGEFTGNITGLNPGTTYYVRAYATTSAGTAYGEQISFTTQNTPANDCGEPVTFTYNGQEVTYGTVLSAGRCWLDRNLGASRVATSSTDAEAYGDLYQWGRGTDGHEKRTSGTTSTWYPTLSNSDTPGHSIFIVAPNSPWDWRSPQNTNLWQGVTGINNPCPEGYRLPSEAELNAERQSWSSNNAAGAFASPLKLPVGGGRSSSDGSLGGVGINGAYWSSSVSSTYSRSLRFSSSGDDIGNSLRASGFTVRCIKD